MSGMLGSASEVLFVIGILLTVAGAVYRVFRREKEPYKGRVTGTVVELVPGKPDSKGKAQGIHDYYYPVFVYYANGRLMKERCRKGSNPPAFRIGDKVSLKYDLDSPDHFIINHTGREDRLERILYIAGLAGIIAGGVCYLLFGLRFLG